MARFFITSLFVLSVLVLGNNQYTQAQIQDCPLIIDKSANPADNTPFVIVLDGNTLIPQITLQDPADPTDQISVPSETAGVTLKENVPAGWRLVDITCDGEPGFSFIILPDDTVVASCEVVGETPPTGQCTFTNVQLQGVPTMSQWGVIVMATILGIAALIVYRRKMLA